MGLQNEEATRQHQAWIATYLTGFLGTLLVCQRDMRSIPVSDAQVVPDNPELGPVHLLKDLLSAISEFKWCAT